MTNELVEIVVKIPMDVYQHLKSPYTWTCEYGEYIKQGTLVKTGAWVPTDEEPHEDYECNKCGYVISTFTANIEPHTEYKYCPNCGARMVIE